MDDGLSDFSSWLLLAAEASSRNQVSFFCPMLSSRPTWINAADTSVNYQTSSPLDVTQPATIAKTTRRYGVWTREPLPTPMT